MAFNHLFAFSVFIGVTLVMQVSGVYDTTHEHVKDCSGVIQNCAYDYVLVSDVRQTGDYCSSVQNYMNCAKRGCKSLDTYSDVLNNEIQRALTTRNINCDLEIDSTRTPDRDLETCQNVINLCANIFRQDVNRTWDDCGSAKKYINCVKSDCHLASDYPNLLEFEVLQSLRHQGIECDFSSYSASTQIVASPAMIVMVVALATAGFAE